jgi:alkanesulfonate monooxygenase SsuD/methylene tetrahydromethanopterin reductase-like flavin-dependent oxidoreductase (luciferase family)
MKVGYLLDTHVGAYDRPAPERDESAGNMAALLDEGVAAEEAGFDGVFVPERHMRTETAWPGVYLLLAALAARTERVDLGTYTTVQTLYDPMHVAEMTSVIDNLSRGRLLLATSMGYHGAYFRMFGLAPRTRVSRFEEGLEVLLRAWSGERFSFSGRRYVYDDVQLVPRPYQRPRPRLWLGTQSDVGIERAGAVADGIAGYPLPLPLEHWRRLTGRFRELAAGHGRPGTLAVMREGFVAATRAEAERLAGEAMLEEFRFAFRKGGFLPHPDFSSLADITLDKLRPHVVMGSVDDCVDAIHRLRDELGIDYLVMRMRFPLGPGFGAVREAIAAFSEVMERSTDT